MILHDDIVSTAPPTVWQSRARYHITRCQMALWSPAGKRGLDYLTKERGLKEETIRHFRLGYSTQDTWDKPELWGLEGKKIFLPGPGIVIPHISGQDEDGQAIVWGMKVRRFEVPVGWKGSKQNWRYTAPRGTVTCMLGLDDFGQGITSPPPQRVGNYKRPLLFCSGEIDLMSAWQEAGPGHPDGALVDVASLAGEAKGVPAIWYDYCMPYELIIIGYDADSEGTRYGSKMVESMPQAKPIFWDIVAKETKDINAILTGTTFNVRRWITSIVLQATTPPAIPKTPNETDWLHNAISKVSKYPVKIFWPIGYPPTGDEFHTGGEIPFDCNLAVYNTPASLHAGLSCLVLFRTALALGGEINVSP